MLQERYSQGIHVGLVDTAQHVLEKPDPDGMAAG